MPAARIDRGAAGSDSAWKRNLWALWVGQFAGVFGFAFVFPFLPLYLNRELGVHDHRQLAIWSGVATGAAGFGMVLASPIWGRVADRYGRKPMVVRAMLGGSLLVFLIGLVQNAAELVGARFVLGVSSGTTAAATALVASETPPHRVGWALGVLSSGVALGRAFGPFAGGILATLLPLRWAFFVGAFFLLLATVPVVVYVHEGPRAAAPAGGRPKLRLTEPLVVLIFCQGLMQFGIASAQQLIVLRVLILHPAGAVLETGLAFGAIGLFTGIAAIFYSRLIPLLGYQRLSTLAALGMAATIAACGLSPTVGPLIFFTAVMGLVYGALSPALSSMLGLEAPNFAKATVFGYAGSATALGMAAGPLGGGALAAAAGLPFGLYVSAAAVLLVALVMALKGRNPLVPAT